MTPARARPRVTWIRLLAVTLLVGGGTVPALRVPTANASAVREQAAGLAGDPAAAVGMVRTPSGKGYRVSDVDGTVLNLGDAAPISSPPQPADSIVGMAGSSDGKGYWLVASDGGVFNFGDARFWGSTGTTRLNEPIVGMAATPDGRGYWLVASDGGIFNFGDARFWGSTGTTRLNEPIVGMAATPDGRGYWLVASDGGIFNFGDARFWGSTGTTRLNEPIVGMAATPDGRGYWLVASDGGVFTFGDAPFRGSSTEPVFGPAAAVTGTPSGGGYWILDGDGDVEAFGDALSLGGAAGPPAPAPVAVGSTTLDVVDAGRSTPSRGSIAAHAGRDLPTLVLYPAGGKAGGPPASGAKPLAGPWPLVVFAHGYDTTPDDYLPLIQVWAAAGFVVAAPYLPGERSDSPGTPNRADLTQEPADLSDVISAVLSASAHAGTPLAGMVDPSRVAVAGHSDGAVAVAGMTLNSAYHDGRIKAALVLSGAELDLPGGHYGGVANVPLLIVQGTADPINDPGNGEQLFGDAVPPKALVRIVDGGHLAPYVGIGAQSDAVREATIDFLDAELGPIRWALSRLAHDGDLPGVTELIAELR